MRAVRAMGKARERRDLASAATSEAVIRGGGGLVGGLREMRSR